MGGPGDLGGAAVRPTRERGRRHFPSLACRVPRVPDCLDAPESVAWVISRADGGDEWAGEVKYVPFRRENANLLSPLSVAIIRFPCQYCNEPLKAPADKAGRKCRCSYCNKGVTIPAPQGEDREDAQTRVRCPGCKQELGVDVTQPGSSVMCGACGTSFVLGQQGMLEEPQQVDQRQQNDELEEVKPHPLPPRHTDGVATVGWGDTDRERREPSIQPISLGKCVGGAVIGGAIGMFVGAFAGCMEGGIVASGTRNASAFLTAYLCITFLCVLFGAVLGWKNAVSSEELLQTLEKRAIREEREELEHRERRMVEEAKRLERLRAEQAERLQRQRAEEAERLQRQRAEEVRRLERLRCDIQYQFLGLPTLVHDAHDYLEAAEKNFVVGAFAPFWDAVERTAKKLAEFNQSLERIAVSAASYRNQAPSYGLPEFRLPRVQIPDPRETAQQMFAMVRKAQMDFHFSSIYEQRRTNRILIAGFSTLSDAIDGMGTMLAESIGQLTLNLGPALDDLFVLMSAQEARAREFEKKATRCLDDLRRRRTF